MREPREYRCVGGPLDGQAFTTGADIVEMAEAPDMAYVVTRPTDTNWREAMNPNWWMMGEPEPVPPARVLEWHERGWESPEVAAIRDVFREAAASVSGRVPFWTYIPE